MNFANLSDLFTDGTLLVDLPPPDTPPIVQTFQCPQMNEAERGLLIAPRSATEWRKAIAEKHQQFASGQLRCLLLVLSPEADPDDLSLEDLHYWAEEARTLLPHGTPIAVSPKEESLPCGRTALCLKCHDSRALQSLIQQQASRHTTLQDGLSHALATLSPRDREILQAWATASAKNAPNRPITAKELAARYHLTDRQIRNIISHARETAPQWVAELELVRTHRLKKTAAYEVRQT